MASFLCTKISKRPRCGDEEQGDHLLPRLPDEITLNHIVTLLPWQGLHMLPSLSRAWREAIRTNQVYDARVYHHATETLVVVHHKVGQAYFLALYSVRNKISYFLPPVPGVPTSTGEFFTLGGKIYVLGVECATTGICIPSRQVYVLDLVGQRRWKQCASMPESGRYSGCGVVDGKIYVIGGRDSLLRWSIQVYDPKEDAWSSITPTPSVGRNCKVVTRNCKVVTLGEELFMFRRNSLKSGRMSVYHPVKNEWRNFNRQVMPGTIFVANGKIYALTPQNFPLFPIRSSFKLLVHVFDMDSKSWTLVHSSRSAALLPRCFVDTRCAVLKVNDELLAFVQLFKGPMDSTAMYLLSKGFGGENEEITWKTVKSSFSSKLLSSMLTVEL